MVKKQPAGRRRSCFSVSDLLLLLNPNSSFLRFPPTSGAAAELIALFTRLRPVGGGRDLSGVVWVAPTPPQVNVDCRSSGVCLRLCGLQENKQPANESVQLFPGAACFFIPAGSQKWPRLFLFLFQPFLAACRRLWQQFCIFCQVKAATGPTGGCFFGSRVDRAAFVRLPVLEELLFASMWFHPLRRRILCFSLEPPLFRQSVLVFSVEQL